MQLIRRYLPVLKQLHGDCQYLLTILVPDKTNAGTDLRTAPFFPRQRLHRSEDDTDYNAICLLQAESMRMSSVLASFSE